MNTLIRSIVLAFLYGPSTANGFTTNKAVTTSFISKPTQTDMQTRMSKSEMKALIDPTIMDALSSTSSQIATIDADIANIADDQFGLVFAGGIVVMFGGVFSALAVGFILNAGQSYGRVIADSYAEEGSGDDPFAGMSDEDRAKAEELLEKLRASKGGSKIPENLGSKTPTIASNESGISEEQMQPIAQEKKEKVSMFSDYDD